MTLAYRLLGAVAASGLLLAAGYWRGSQAEHKTHVARESVAAQRVNAAREKLVAQLNTLQTQTTQARGEQETVTREIIREVPKVVRGSPVYRNMCVESAGVQLLDRAAANANRGLAGSVLGAPAPAAGDAPQP